MCCSEVRRVLHVEQRGPHPGLLDLHHDYRAPVRRYEGVLDVAGWIFYEPAHRLFVHAPHAQPAVGLGLGDEEDSAPVGEPGCRDLDPRAEVQDLAVFEAINVDQPDLLSGGASRCASRVCGYPDGSARATGCYPSGLASTSLSSVCRSCL